MTKIKTSNFFVGLSTFMMAVYMFQIDSLLDNGLYQLFIKIPFFIAALYIFINIRFFKPNLTTMLLLLYTAAMMISNLLTSEITLNMIMSASIQMFFIMNVSISSRKGYLHSAVMGLFVFFLTICSVNDLIWAVHGFQPLIEGNTRLSLLPQFFLGNKFSVMYDHIILSALFLAFYKGKHRRNWIIALGIILIILSFTFDCATTAVASLAFMIMLLIEGKKKTLLESKATMGIALAAGAIFPFLGEAIMQIGFIQKIVVSFLGRNATLTGRIGIFTHIVSLIKNGLLWGLGRSNTTSAIVAASRAANIQNGFWQIAITYGIIAAALLICSSLSAVRPVLKKNIGINQYTVLILIYTFILIGFVEISYGATLLVPVVIYNELCEGKGRMRYD